MVVFSAHIMFRLLAMHKQHIERKKITLQICILRLTQNCKIEEILLDRMLC